MLSTQWNVTSLLTQLHASSAQNGRRAFPRLVDEVIWQGRQLWTPLSHIVSIGVTGQGCINRVHDKVPLVKATHASILPHHGIDGHISVKQCVLLAINAWLWEIATQLFTKPDQTGIVFHRRCIQSSKVHWQLLNLILHATTMSVQWKAYKDSTAQSDACHLFNQTTNTIPHTSHICLLQH